MKRQFGVSDRARSLDPSETRHGSDTPQHVRCTLPQQPEQEPTPEQSPVRVGLSRLPPVAVIPKQRSKLRNVNENQTSKSRFDQWLTAPPQPRKTGEKYRVWCISNLREACDLLLSQQETTVLAAALVRLKRRRSF